VLTYNRIFNKLADVRDTRSTAGCDSVKAAARRWRPIVYHRNHT
jgi:hypothetical protein